MKKKKTGKKTKFFGKGEKRKNRVLNLKGVVGKIIISRDYSFSQRGDIHLLRNGEEIRSFPKGVTAKEIEEYVLGYEAILKKEKEKKGRKNTVKKSKISKVAWGLC